MATELHAGDVGATLRVTLTDDGKVFDIASATTKDFILGRPNHTSFTVSAVFTTDGTDGVLEFVTTASANEKVGTG